MLKLVLICLMLLLGGCSATGLIDCEGFYTYVPEHFTLEERYWIEESAERWNDWVGYRLLVVEPGYRPACTIHDGKTTDPPKIGSIRHPTESITIDKEDLQKYKDLTKHKESAYKDVFEGVVMHELGHGLGFKHRGKNGSALMAPAGSLDFTDIDRMQCIELGICKTLNPPMKHD